MRTSFIFLAACLVILLMLCVLSTKINPYFFSPLAFFGFVFPFIAIANLVVFPFLFRRSTFWFAAAGITLFLSIPQLTKIMAFPFIGKSDGEPELKVMTYNVRNFDLYNWHHNEISRKEILQTIQDENADIISFQEFFDQKEGRFQNVKALEKLGYVHHIFVEALILRDNDLWGISIFSKHPIVNHGEFLKQTFKTGYGRFPNRGMYADIKIQDDTIRVVNVHLQSIYFHNEDYKAISEAKEGQEVNLGRSKQVLKKVNRAYKRRGFQTKEVKAFLKENQSYPLIFCGDFNDTPYSYSYQQISRQFQDAFIKGGVGIGSTYNGDIPGLRIDFILLDKTFRVHKSRVVKNERSDHFPLVTEISLP